jgi:hypothetical protein
MSTEIVKQESGERTPATMSQIVLGLLQGDRSKIQPGELKEFLEIQKWCEERDAEKQFNIDFAAALKEMPRITKDGVIDMGTKGKMAFARYEDVDKAIKPIEDRHGFSRSFITAPSMGEPGITITLKLRHSSGHCETSTRHMPPDPGAGRNGMQAIGSAGSYGKRYLTLDCWNIVTVGADDDGASTDYITVEQQHRLEEKMADLGMNEQSKVKMLETLDAKSLADIRKGAYQVAMNLLAAKGRKVDGK